MATISKNAPCPCGSGKKYKLCCQAKDEAAAPPPPSRAASPEQYRAAVSELWGRLLQFVRQPAVRPDLGRALGEYFPDDVGGPPPSYEATPADFFEWLVFDRRRKEGGTLLDVFLGEKGARLLLREQEVCALLRASHVDLFEVKDARKGEPLVLGRVLGDGVEVRPFERAAGDAPAGTLLAARLVQPSGTGLFTQGRVVFPPGEREPLLAFLEAERAKRWGGSAWPDFFKAEGGLFRLFFMRRIVEARRRAEAGPPPEPKVLAMARYDMLEVETALEMVRGFPGMQEKGKEGERVLLSWKVGKTDDPFPADVVVTPRELRLTCFSRETLRAARKTLEAALGRLVSHREDEFRTP